jgi:hypothetical protein
MTRIRSKNNINVCLLKEGLRGPGRRQSSSGLERRLNGRKGKSFDGRIGRAGA